MNAERFKEIERVCQAALDQPRERRDAFLERACQGDAALRAEVEALLAGASRAASLLEKPVCAVPAPALSSGERLGPYEVTRKIGAGGMGEVYEARDTRLGRTVAIKVLPPGFSADPERRTRLEREAKTVAALSHPHICPLFDVGEHEGAMFLVMERLVGQTLAERMEKGRLPLEQALTIGMEIATALSAAHREGVVHRDLKPGNVMLTKSGARLLDFGLAKVLAHAEPPASAALTREGTIVGTLHYMAPEQLEGRQTDARTDVWALGAILYEMVTGTRPFEGDSQASVIAAILDRDPVPLATVYPAAPPALDRLIRKCLEKDPQARRQSAADVAGDLKSALSDLPNESQAGAARRLRAPVRGSTRRRWRRIAAVLVALIPLVGGGAWFAWRYVREAQLRALLAGKDVVVLADFVNTTGDPAFDLTLREALSNEIQNSNVVRALSPALTRVVLADMKRPAGAPITPAVAQEVCVRAGEKATVEGSIASLGSTYVLSVKAVNCQTGDTLASQVVPAADKEHVLSALAAAIGGVREKLGESLPNLQRTSTLPGTTTSFDAFRAYAMGVTQAARGQWAGAIPHYARAADIDPNFASAYMAEAIACIMIGQANRGRALIRTGFEHRASANERERLWIEGRYYEEEGEFDKARSVFEQLVQLYPNHQLGVNSLANMHREFGDWEKAVPLSREFIRLSPELPVGYTLLMMTLMQLDRFEEARAVAQMPVPKRMHPPEIWLPLLRLAYLEGDHAAAQAAIDGLDGTTFAVRGLGIQEAHAFAAGMFRSADALQTRADEIARRQNLGPAALAARLEALVWKANAGLCAEVEAAVTPQLLGGDSVRGPAAIAAIATCGNAAKAQSLVEALVKAGTTRGQVWADAQLPLIKAREMLAQERPAEAVAALEPARVFERAVAGIALARGEAYLASGRPADAVAEFRKILAVKANSLRNDCSAAQVGLARALAASGDTAGARKAYVSFFDLWKSADPGVPLLVAARREHAALVTATIHRSM